MPKSSKQIASEAIEIVDATRKELFNLFRGSSELQLRTDNVLKRLMNGYAHAEGLNLQEDMHIKVQEAKPLTHIGGVKIDFPAGTKSIKEARPTVEEQEEFEGFIDLAYNAFQSSEPLDIRSSFNDLVIRAVAVKAGMQITSMSSKVVDITFINAVKEAIAVKEDRLKQLAAPAIKESQPTVEESPKKSK